MPHLSLVTWRCNRALIVVFLTLGYRLSIESAVESGLEYFGGQSTNESDLEKWREKVIYRHLCVNCGYVRIN